MASPCFWNMPAVGTTFFVSSRGQHAPQNRPVFDVDEE